MLVADIPMVLVFVREPNKAGRKQPQSCRRGATGRERN